MKRFTVIACVIFSVLLFPLTASADIGPKPSVVIDFEGLTDEAYYVTLLSSTRTTGPYSVFKEGGYSHYNIGDREYPVFLKFLEYEDTDGFYFLQFLQDCTSTHQFKWTYYPPSSFKILLYFPNTNRFAISAEVYEKYAFDSYYKVTLNGLDMTSVTAGETTFTAEKNYDYSNEIISLAVRIILTIAAELLIALLFMPRGKSLLCFVAAVNIITQIALNLALNYINFSMGQMALVFFYILLEILVFIIEAFIYAAFMGRYADVTKRKAVIYALVANTVSFAAGLSLAHIIPGIF